MGFGLFDLKAEVVNPCGMSKLELEKDKFDALGKEIEVSTELNDENITQEQINDMKRMAIYKPNGVSWLRWQRVQDVRTEHEHMIHLASSGLPQNQIAEITGYQQAHISKVLRAPEVKQRINSEVEKIYGEDHKKAIKSLAMKAIGVVDDVLSFGKESEKAAMARWALEHSVGKAEQKTTEVKTSLSEVIIKIEQMTKDNLLRNVGSGNGELAKPIDPFDTIIDKVIPKGMVVGKRSNGGIVEGKKESGLHQGVSEKSDSGEEEAF